MSRLAFPVLAAALVLAAAGCKQGGSGAADGSSVRLDIERFRVELAADDHALGGDAPLVTVVVFSDYACRPCARSWKVLENVVEDYGDDVRVVFRSMTVPGFARGEQAIEAAYAAGLQGKFWDMHRRLFEASTDFTRPVLRAHAEALGLDVQRFLDDMDTGATSGRRARDKRQAKALGVLVAPAAFVNGVPVVGFKDETVWHGLLDEEIARARQMIRDGTPRAKLYEAMMQGALTRPITDPKDVEALKQRLAKQRAEDAAPKKTISPRGDQRYRIPLDDSPVRGPADAPVLIVEFLDFQCPLCRKAWSESVPKVLEKFEKDVRMAVVHLPLEIHVAARGAAEASMAAHRQGKFWAFHDRLIAHEGAMGRSTFVELARELGLDVDRFLRDLDAPETKAKIAADLDLARRLGVDATPSFFVNGRYFKGFQPQKELAAVVEAELAAAKEKIAAGTPREQVLDAVLEGAVGEEQYPNR